MAAFDTARPLANVTFGAGFTQKISRVFGALAAWNDARVTRKALTQLSARELDDIGLVPGDIEAIASGRR
ncbi:MAG: DUF1127 domain-containing protein [Pseudomonadota bacterium]